jgi:5-methyltetrahydrofolate--homocysteine methyltransferase
MKCVGEMKPFRDNFERIKEQYRLWWRMENRRPLVYMSVRESGPFGGPAFDPADPAAWHLDADVVFEHKLAVLEKWHYDGIGEGFPFLYPNFPVPAFFGATPVFSEATIWHRRIETAGDPYDAIHFDESNPWWRRSMAFLERLAEMAEGHFLLSLPNLYAPFDVIELLVGAEVLCLDMIDRPDHVKAARDRVLPAFIAQHDAEWDLLRKRVDGCGCGFLSIWCPGRGLSLQCDFSYMISGEMFDEFIMPEVEAQVASADYTMYHLDGPCAAHHADALLKVDKLDGFQWQKGANGGATLDWIPLLQKMQKGGKRIMVDGSPDEVVELSDTLAPEGLLLIVNVPDEQSAQELMNRICRRFV